jgi:hypothetical protein
MIDSLRRRILNARDTQGAEPRFIERLLDGLRRIEAEFEGSERERLLTRVAETLDRHLEIREHSGRTREALAQLRADHARIVQFLTLLADGPETRTLH